MIKDALQEIFAEEQIHDTENETHPFGNHAPHIIYPRSEEEIAAILKKATEHSWKVIPMGGGTKRGWGGVQERADLILSLQSLQGIVEHSVGDMTVTVRPGTTMQALSESLAENEQMVPVDPFLPEAATIGGVVAANDSGPKRIRYGSVRDHIIGTRVVYPDGRIIRTGGKTVKNVAGYDMNKLFVGSMGTLGVLSELTLKLRPIPKYSSLVLLTFSPQHRQRLKEFIIALQDSMLEPFSLEVLSPRLHERLNQRLGIGLAIAFEDVHKAVEYEEQWVQSHMPEGAELDILRQDEAKEWWSAFARIAPQGSAEPQVSSSDRKSFSEIALKMGSKNLHTLDLVEHCHRLGEERDIRVEAHGGAGHGISRAYVQGNSDRLLSFVQDLRSIAQELGGYAIVQHAPLELRKKLQVWGEKPSYFSILEGIKKAVDPNLILNDKRFVGGI